MLLNHIWTLPACCFFNMETSTATYTSNYSQHLAAFSSACIHPIPSPTPGASPAAENLTFKTVLDEGRSSSKYDGKSLWILK